MISLINFFFVSKILFISTIFTTIILFLGLFSFSQYLLWTFVLFLNGYFIFELSYDSFIFNASTNNQKKYYDKYLNLINCHKTYEGSIKNYFKISYYENIIWYNFLISYVLHKLKENNSMVSIYLLIHFMRFEKNFLPKNLNKQQRKMIKKSVIFSSLFGMYKKELSNLHIVFGEKYVKRYSIIKDDNTTYHRFYKNNGKCYIELIEYNK